MNIRCMFGIHKPTCDISPYVDGEGILCRIFCERCGLKLNEELNPRGIPPGWVVFRDECFFGECYKKAHDRLKSFNRHIPK